MHKTDDVVFVLVMTDYFGNYDLNLLEWRGDSSEFVKVEFWPEFVMRCP